MGIVSWMEENFMPGLTPSAVMKNKSLWPMYACVGGGVVLAAWFSVRTLLINPDGIDPLTGRGNWEKYRDKEFKLFNISGVVLPCQAPEYRKPGDPSDDSYAHKNIGTVHLQLGYKPHQ